MNIQTLWMSHHGGALSPPSFGHYPLLFVIWLAPLAAAIVNWAFGPQLKRMAGVIGSTSVAVSFIATIASWRAATQTDSFLDGENVTFFGAHQHLFSWMPGFDFGLLLDPLSLLWTLIITGVGFLILVYSIGYMWTDGAVARFFAYMNFFVFAMLTLVLSDNFVGLLLGWGLVGLASYFLIGYWFFKPTAVAAARKAFVINVVGDVAIMFAIFMIFAKIGSLSFADVFVHHTGHAYSNVPLLGGSLSWICAFLFIGAAAKSAQIPLHTWLPDAMEGPTPVSALIHAATMVTAGVYLIARCWPLWSYSHDAQMLAGIIGTLTAVTGALLGLAQWDIKRILAYSTMSQIGYMIAATGVTAYTAGVAHFFTHAFFKACLFLAAGIVIHEVADEQDIRRMGGMRTRTPVAFWSMLVAVLAISGFPGLSGFFSKDQVIYGALQHGHPWIAAALVVTAGITAYYMFRLFFVTFFGQNRAELDPATLGIAADAVTPPVAEPHATEHAPSWIMSLPVVILAVFAVIAGYGMIGGANSAFARLLFGALPGSASTWESLPEPALSELALSVILFVVMAGGIAVAYWRYATAEALANAPARLRAESERMPAVLVNLYYFDDVIDWLIVRPAQATGRFFGSIFDPEVIDGTVRGLVALNRSVADGVRSLQDGLLRSYALIVVFGAALFAIYYALAGAAR